MKNFGEIIEAAFLTALLKTVKTVKNENLKKYESTAQPSSIIK